jgi:hypothetical protein
VPAVDQKPRTESLYLRTSSALREDAQQFGEDRGLTLSSALAVLVERGLEAVTDETSVATLERRVQVLSTDLAVLSERDRNWRAIFNSLQAQLQTLPVGRCPACQQAVTAHDQFLARRCPWPDCREPLVQVLPLPTPSEEVQRSPVCSEHSAASSSASPPRSGVAEAITSRTRHRLGSAFADCCCSAT